MIENKLGIENHASDSTAKSRVSKYKKIILALQGYAETRMGYPYIGPVRGYFTDSDWVLDYSSTDKLVDNSVLGVTANSIADTYINNSGSPYTKSTYIQRDVKDIEVDLLNILTNFFGCVPGSIKGYVTTGSTEANLASFWWLRECLKDNKDENIYLLATDHAHYSIKKISNLLSLKVVTIKSLENGAMDIDSFKETLRSLVSKSISCKLIVSLNVGSTELGAIDDIPLISKVINDFKMKYHFESRIHADAALLGLSIPILKTIGPKSIFEYVDTFVFSGHKLLGTTSISGVALARSAVWRDAFDNHTLSVNYLAGIEDSTVLGSRSGYSVIEFHHALCSLNVDRDASNLKKLIKTFLKNAEYLASELRMLLGSEKVMFNKNQFTVVFPFLMGCEEMPLLLKKYGLMSVREGRLGICVLAHVSRKLIDEFISEYQRCMNSTTKLLSSTYSV